MSRLRVPAGYVIAVIVLGIARPRPDWLALALVCVVLGEAIRVWASGHIEKTRRLATGGPYAQTRNPLYVGSLLIAVGVALVSGHVAAVAAIAVYFAAFYPAVMKEEERFLREKFEDEYTAWADSVPDVHPAADSGRAAHVALFVVARLDEPRMAQRRHNPDRRGNALRSSRAAPLGHFDPFSPPGHYECQPTVD